MYVFCIYKIHTYLYGLHHDRNRLHLDQSLAKGVSWIPKTSQTIDKATGYFPNPGAEDIADFCHLTWRY